MSVSEEIGRLAQLRDQGILTDEEFQQQKTVLLAAQQSAPAAMPRGKIVKGVGIGCLLLLALIMLPAIIGAIRGTSGGVTQPPGSGVTITTGGGIGTGVGMDNYNRLRTGMSYREVVTILGAPGQELSRNEMAGTETVMYQWQGIGLGNMNAMFQNDRLIQKSQAGL